MKRKPIAIAATATDDGTIWANADPTVHNWQRTLPLPDMPLPESQPVE